MANAFDRLHVDLQRVLWDMQWRELRPLQTDTIHAWLDSGDDLLLMAHTAAGKTEAAFLPILSGLAPDRGAGSFRAMYVGPLKALINDQFRRLEQLCDRAEIPVHRWHGDVDQGKKRKALKDPTGVLLITPESLEAMLMLRGRFVAQFFSRLDAVVIDELHVFLDSERGRQFSSLLHRLDIARGKRARRVGLSATIGSPEDALRWLSGKAGSGRLIKGEGGGEFELLVKTFMSDPRKPAGDDNEADDEDEGTGGLVGIAQHIHENFRGRTNLVFCNSKNQIESLSDNLRRLAERDRVPNEFRVHHGSLSREIRHDVEKELQSGRPCTALCSSTLELGIDVGDCDAVGQVEPPHSVSALRQRLGRSGRKEGSVSRLWLYIPLKDLAPDARLTDRLHFPLIRAIAEVELMLEGWVEPAFRNKADLSTLIQQVLSTIRQTGGLKADELFQTLGGCPAFEDVGEELFTDVLRDLGATDLIEQTATGELILGLKGEKLTDHYDFYAAFESSEEWEVINGKRVIGSLVPSPAYTVGSALLLAGSRWSITSVDAEQRAIHVQPARRKQPLVFPAWSGHVHGRVREKMLEVLRGAETPAYLDATSQPALRNARKAAANAGVGRDMWIQSGKQAYLVVARGSRALQMLAADFNVNGIAALAWPNNPFELGLVFHRETKEAEVLARLAQFTATPPNPEQLCLQAHEQVIPPVGKHTGVLGRRLRAAAYAAENYKWER